MTASDSSSLAAASPGRVAGHGGARFPAMTVVAPPINPGDDDRARASEFAALEAELDRVRTELAEERERGAVLRQQRDQLLRRQAQLDAGQRGVRLADDFDDPLPEFEGY
jgi:hypothetical protein